MITSCLFFFFFESKRTFFGRYVSFFCFFLFTFRTNTQAFSKYQLESEDGELEYKAGRKMFAAVERRSPDCGQLF